MQRKQFIQLMATGTAGALTLGSFKNLTDQFPEQDERMPALFIGHGSPMNGIEDNEFSLEWAKIAREVPRPKAILVVSAHWLTSGTHITAMPSPKMIYDFGGFPKPLYEVKYPAPGSPELARETAELIKKTQVGLNHDWGFDHGSWTVVRRMYPEADIPMLQLSIDYARPASFHHELAGELAALRKKGVLIIGSGNMVHNLRMVNFSMGETGFDWAIEMNETFKKHIADGNHQPLIDWEKLGPAAKLAIPTPDHYYPLMYTLGMKQAGEAVQFFNDKPVAGSLTMTSVRLG